MKSIFILIIGLFTACVTNSYDGKLELQNNSNRRIGFQAEDSEEIEFFRQFNYAYHKTWGNDSMLFSSNLIFGKGRINYTFPSWEEFFSENEKLYLFVFDVDTVEVYPWDTIRANNMYLKKYILTEKQLDSLDWIITYP